MGDVAPIAERAADALAAAWTRIAEARDGGWSERRPGLAAAFTGLPAASFNGVWATRADCLVPDAEELLDRLAATGLPHNLQFPPAAAASLEPLARRRGMRHVGLVPLMVLDRTDLPTADDELAIRRLEPAEAGEHVALAAPVFGMPPDVLGGLMEPAAGLAGAACYVGSVGGEDVVTGYGLVHEGSVGVFNIATPESHRRRGHGAAMTRHIVRDGAARGARWAWLQSSGSGYGVYERLGFRPAGSWPCFASP